MRQGQGGGRGPAHLLSEVEVVPAALRRSGFLFEAVRALDGRPAFASLLESADTAGAKTLEGFGHFIGELCRAAAALYLANPQARVAYVHALTAPSALRSIAPYLSETTRERAAGCALQAAAALHAVAAHETQLPHAEPDDEVLGAAEDAAETRYHAACSLQEHSIKFAEACLREDALAPDPVFRLAAADGALRIRAADEARC